MTIERGELPVQQHERIAVIDILRGFALFGVIISNLVLIVYLQSPPEMLERVSLPMDVFFDKFQLYLMDGKFVTLFAMLFGYGFGILLKRLELKAIPANGFFVRRMAILFGLGLLHLCLFWGDILHVYSIAGLLLLFFRRSSDRALLVFAVLFGLVLPWGSMLLREAVLDIHITPTAARAAFPLFTSSHFTDIIAANFSALSEGLRRLVEVEWLSNALGSILFGYWLMRKDFFARIDHYLPVVRKIWWLGLLGLPITLGQFVAKQQDLLSIPWVHYVTHPVLKLGVILTSLFYSTSVIQLHRKGHFLRLFQLFGHVGRMSLTNYMLQSVLIVVLFYGVGFGMLGQVSYRHAWLYGSAFYAGQSMFSAWWMRRYHYGPVEWVWRQLSYGRRFPIRRVPPSVA